MSMTGQISRVLSRLAVLFAMSVGFIVGVAAVVAAVVGASSLVERAGTYWEAGTMRDVATQTAWIVSLPDETSIEDALGEALDRDHYDNPDEQRYTLTTGPSDKPSVVSWAVDDITGSLVFASRLDGPATVVTGDGSDASCTTRVLHGALAASDILDA